MFKWITFENNNTRLHHVAVFESIQASQVRNSLTKHLHVSKRNKGLESLVHFINLVVHHHSSSLCHGHIFQHLNGPRKNRFENSLIRLMHAIRRQAHSWVKKHVMLPEGLKNTSCDVKSYNVISYDIMIIIIVNVMLYHVMSCDII